MKSPMLKLILVFAFTIALATGCVSVQLSPNKTDRDSEVDYDDPEDPFQKIETSSFDHAWRNPQNGNSIAYLSECGKNTESSLKSIERESLSALAEIKIGQSKAIRHEDADGIKSDATGQLEGAKMRIQLLILRKKDCNYILSLVGKTSRFEEDISKFDEFVEEFELP